MSSITATGPGRSEPLEKNSTAATAKGPIDAKQSASSSTAGAAGDDADAVNLSAPARQAARVDAAIDREAFFDAARVAALRSAIENGEYRVDTDRLAQAITQFELQR